MEAARHSLDGVRGAPWQGLHVASAARGKGCTWQGHGQGLHHRVRAPWHGFMRASFDGFDGLALAGDADRR